MYPMYPLYPIYPIYYYFVIPEIFFYIFSY